MNKIEQIRVFTTGCKKCKSTHTPHKILLGYNEHELGKIYIQCCTCNFITEVTNITESQIKDIEKNANK